MLACRGHVCCVTVKTMDEVGLVGAQCRRQLAVAATDMDNDPALDPGRGQDLVCQLLLVGKAGAGQGGQGKCKADYKGDSV